MPASSQPVEPSAGFTRFHTSVKASACGARRLAHRAGEAHARPVPVALGDELEQVRLEPHHVGLLLRAQILLQLVVELVGGELADVLESTVVVRRLQLEEVHFRGAQEAGSIEAGGNRRSAGRGHRRGADRNVHRLAHAGVLHRSHDFLALAPARERAHCHDRQDGEAGDEQDAHQAVAAEEIAEHAAEREPAEDRHPAADRSQPVRPRLRALLRRRGLLCGLRRRLRGRCGHVALRADVAAAAETARLRVGGDERTAQRQNSSQKKPLAHIEIPPNR